MLEAQIGIWIETLLIKKVKMGWMEKKGVEATLAASSHHRRKKFGLR
jgi:hypothetical protein